MASRHLPFVAVVSEKSQPLDTVTKRSPRELSPRRKNGCGASQANHITTLSKNDPFDGAN
jgi:hypothetical protein